jgi:chitodextrinase
MPGDTNSHDRRSVIRSIAALAAASASGATVTGARTDTGDWAGAFSPLGQVAIDGAAEAVTSDDGRTAYVSTDPGFVSVDIADPSDPSVLARREETGVTGIKDVKVDGDRLIVQGPANGTGRTNGFGLYDVRDPAAPERLAFVETDYGIHNAYLDDGIAYIIDNGAAEIVLFDVADDDPTEVGRWGLDGARTLHDLWVQDEVGYLNFWDQGTAIVDVSDPAAPSLISTVRDGSSRRPNNDHYVMVNDDASILAIGKEQIGRSNLGVELWDISTPTDASFLAEIDPPSGSGERTSHNFDLVGDYLYTSWYRGGIRVHDIGDPSNPEQIASWAGDDASFWTAKVAVPGSVVVGSDYGGGLYTFDDPREDTSRPPTATIDAPGTVGVGVSVTFDGRGSSDPDGGITSYRWEYGDGSSGTGRTASHTYEATGEYTVTLRVTDDDGNTDTATTTVSVTDRPNEPPTASVSVQPSAPSVGATVTFDGTSSSDPDGTLTSYEWSVDGSPVASGETAEYSFETPGDHEIELVVTDDAGSMASATRSIDVSEGGGGACGDESNSGTTSGYLWFFDNSDEYTYPTETSDPCTVSIELDGPENANFDLFVTLDGRTPTSSDYDRKATSPNAREELLTEAIDASTELGILVQRRSDSGQYTLTVEERGR